MSEVDRPAPVRQVFWLTLVGVLLLQSAWMMSLPTFRGPDEFDHAYKAAAVARGEVHSEGEAQDGRGGLVTVPRDLVVAASNACESRSYTGHDNCHPVNDSSSELVQVATAAGAYNPTWYAAVGTVTRWVPGADLDLAMRLVTALMAALLLAWGAAITAAWSRSRWPLLAFSLAATPTLVYSTVIVSPNGVHYAAAMLAWSAALGFARGDRPTRFLVPFTAGASIMVCTHTTGPLWLALLGLVVLLLRPLRWWTGVIRANPVPWGLGALVTVAATLASVAWTRTANANALGPTDPDLPSFHASLLVRSEILWPFQTVGAFPMRDDPAPWLVYVVWFTGFVVLAGLGLRRASRRVRWVALLLVAAVLVVPGVLTMISFSSNGLAWQGRYGLPLSMGMPLLAGWCLDRDPPRLGRHVTMLAGVAFGVAQLSAVVHVAAKEMREYDVDPIAGLFTGGVVVMALLALAGPVVSAGLANRPRRWIAVEQERVPVSVA